MTGAESARAGALPSVTVVVATRDRPELLREALAAVRDQDYEGSVLTVVVFDQSPADTSLVSSEARREVQVLSNTREPGLAGSRNTGILAADSELVAFCDDDDRWSPSRLSSQVRALAEEPGAVLATCGIRVLYGDHSTQRCLTQRRVHFQELLRSRLTELHPSTFLAVRRELLDRVGLVDEHIPGSYAEDYDFLLRAARVHPVVNVPEALVDIRWHEQSYFTRRWDTIVSALTWLLEQHPEFSGDRRGEARVLGQIAFAEAARGRRRAAVARAAATLRRNPRELRGVLALAVAAGAVSPDRVLRELHHRGRGM